MDFRFVVNQLGRLCVVISVILAGLTAWTWWHSWQNELGETACILAMTITTGVSLVLGGGLWWLGRTARRNVIGRREAMLLVALSWFTGAVIGAMPFYFWAVLSPDAPKGHPFLSFVDCYFESMSGLSTAGSSILSDIEVIPDGLLMWRSLLHWLGGLGIVVLFVIVLPSVGVGSKRLMSVESPVHSRSGMRPRINQTARTLLWIYIGLTIAEIVSLVICGMSLFDSINHAFATIATGGFSTRNASVGAYDSAVIDWVITLFMILGGTSFYFYYLVCLGRVRDVLRSIELRVYLASLLVVIAISAYSIYGTTIVTTTGKEVYASAGESLRYAAFNVASMHTDTGFATADFDLWPDVARAAIFVATIIGGCVGSTSGGIKIIRFWVMFGVIRRSIEQTFRTGIIRPIRTGSGAIPAESQAEAMTYIVTFVGILFIGAALIHLMEKDNGIDMVTSLTASIAVICDAGPGLGKVGPTQNFGWMTAESKLVLTTLMILGRLEIFALLALVTPRFWKVP